MSLLFLDGFDYYGDQSDLEKKWDAQNSPGESSYLPSGGRFGKGAWRIAGGTASRPQLLTTFPADSEVIFGFAFKFTDNLNQNIMASLGYAGDTYLNLALLADGTLAFTNQAGWPDLGKIITGTSIEALHQDAWYYIEAKCSYDDPNGNVEVRVNEEVWLNESYGYDFVVPQDIPAFNDFFLGGHSGLGSESFWYDDFYLLSTSGPRLDDFLGDVRIETLLPTADEDVEFTPKVAGPNFEMIDDTALDEDGTWNESDVQGDRDLYIMEDIGATPDEIFAIQASVCARKTDAGTRQIGAVVRDPDGNVDSATPHGLITDYLYEQFIYETNPFTGSPWTEQEINHLDVGYEVPSS